MVENPSRCSTQLGTLHGSTNNSTDETPTPHALSPVSWRWTRCASRSFIFFTSARISDCMPRRASRSFTVFST